MNEQHPRAKSIFAIKPLAACLAAVLATGGLSAAGHTFAAAAHAANATQIEHPHLQAFAPYFRDSAQHRQQRALQTRHSTSAVPNRPAGLVPVTSCADDGTAGTLRNVAASAVSGDVLDLSALACSTITLTQGAIMTDLADLGLQGPSTGTLTIDGGGEDAVLYHAGSGTLSVDHLTITNGYGYYVGGGINSAGNVTLSSSTVTGNTAYYQGAGVYAGGVVTIKSSTVSGNTAISQGNYGLGGGVMGGTGLTIQDSTLSANNAYVGAGAYSFGPMTVSNSTISGNTADIVGGGLMSQYAISLHSSTVAFNGAGQGGGGVFVTMSEAPDLQSSIVANNSATTPTYAADLAAPNGVTVTGSHNLIVDSDATLPADTLGSDPLLQLLADNGGPTQTHALGTGSPAIDAGSNPDSLDFDQRGSGFARVSGASADIGAFEVQGTSDDVIFKDGFDGPATP